MSNINIGVGRWVKVSHRKHTKNIGPQARVIVDGLSIGPGFLVNLWKRGWIPLVRSRHFVIIQKQRRRYFAYLVYFFLVGVDDIFLSTMSTRQQNAQFWKSCKQILQRVCPYYTYHQSVVPDKLPLPTTLNWTLQAHLFFRLCMFFGQKENFEWEKRSLDRSCLENHWFFFGALPLQFLREILYFVRHNKHSKSVTT